MDRPAVDRGRESKLSRRAPSTWPSLRTDAGFTDVKLVPTSGKSGVFGKIDAGARTTLGIYFMYDVKQFVPEEWSSPPLEAKLVQKEGLGTVCMGRGAVNQKGPENSFLSALMAFKAAGKKLPVNLVLVCEGEEEIASPHFSRSRDESRSVGRTQEVRRRFHARGRSGSRRRGSSVRWGRRASSNSN